MDNGLFIFLLILMILIIGFLLTRKKKQEQEIKGYIHSPSSNLEKSVQYLINAVIQVRMDEGNLLVYEDERLSNLAQLRAKAITKDFSHSGFSSLHKILSEQGMDSSGEIIAKGYNSVFGVIQGFLNSPSHKKILLEPKFQYVGAGIEEGEDGRYYYVVLFGYDKEIDKCSDK